MPRMRRRWNGESGKLTGNGRIITSIIPVSYTHLQERVKAHNEGRGAKYTKSRRPVSLAYYEVFATKEEAMKREWAIKKLSRREKERLVEGFLAENLMLQTGTS